MAAYVGKKIRVTTNDGIYKGIVHSLDVSCSKITLKKVECCVGEEKTQLKGLQHFYGPELEHLELLEDKGEETIDKNDTEDGGPPLVTRKENPKHLQQLRDYNMAAAPDRGGGGGYVSDGVLEMMKSNLRRKDNRRRPNCARGKKSVRFYPEGGDHVSGDGRSLKYTVVDSLQGQLYRHAVDHISDQSVIGLAVQGINIGRKGKICWLQVGTRTSIFLFDVLTLGAACFDAGLGQILQDENILKVMHNCRNASDALWHQYGLSLVNIFDTQVADVMVSRMDHHGEFPRYVNGLTVCLMEHLDINEENLHFLRVRLDHKEEDQAIWAERPLPDHLLDAAAKNVMFLRDLRVALTDKLMSEFVMGVDVYLSVRRDSSDKDALRMDTMGHLLPGRFKEVVEQAARKRRQHIEPIDQNGFRENCDGVADGTVCLSRDMWHDGKIPSKGMEDSTAKPTHTASASVPAVEDGNNTKTSGHQGEAHLCPDTAPVLMARSGRHPKASIRQTHQTSPRDTLTLTPAGVESTRYLNRPSKKLLKSQGLDGRPYAKTAEESSRDSATDQLTELCSSSTSSKDDMPELWSIPPTTSHKERQKGWMPLTVQLGESAKSDTVVKNPPEYRGVPRASPRDKVYNMKGEEVKCNPEQTAPKPPFFCMPKVTGSSTAGAPVSNTTSPHLEVGGRLVKNPHHLHGWDRQTTVENKGEVSGPDVLQYSSHSSEDDLLCSASSPPPSSHSSSATSPTKDGAKSDVHSMRGVHSSSPSFCIGRGALRMTALKALTSLPDSSCAVPKSDDVQQGDKNNRMAGAGGQSPLTVSMAGVGPPSGSGSSSPNGRKVGIGRASALILRTEMYSELALPDELHKNQQEQGLKSNVTKHPFPPDSEIKSVPKPQRGFLRNW